MFVTKKYHTETVKMLERALDDRDLQIDKLRKDLEEAKNLKTILEKVTGGLSITGGIKFFDGIATWSFPDNVLQYVDDILGGKVIKQEGTKCLIIDKEGNVKTGLTKQKVDKGYKYKLIRE